MSLAAVVAKDFGGDRYLDEGRIPDLIRGHYACRVEQIGALDIPRSETFIRGELTKRRPLVVYFDDILDVGLVTNGHAAVIDGMATERGRFLVHINFGWGVRTTAGTTFTSCPRNEDSPSCSGSDLSLRSCSNRL